MKDLMIIDTIFSNIAADILYGYSINYSTEMHSHNSNYEGIILCIRARMKEIF